jgi:hypothetical protein
LRSAARDQTWPYAPPMGRTTEAPGTAPLAQDRDANAAPSAVVRAGPALGLDPGAALGLDPAQLQSFLVRPR